MVFIEQQINYDQGLTISNIKNFLKEFDEIKLLNIIKKFQAAQLIQCNKTENIEYYYAIYP